MFRRNKAAKAKPLQPDDLAAIPGWVDDPSLGRVIKPTNELKLRCTEFNENGDVTLVNGEFKKSELIAKVCIAQGLLVRIHLLTEGEHSTVFCLEICAKSIPPFYHTYLSVRPPSSSTYYTSAA